MNKNIFTGKIFMALLIMFQSQNAFSKSFRIYEESGECASYRMEFDVRSMKYMIKFCDFPSQVLCLFKDSSEKWYILCSSEKKTDLERIYGSRNS